MTDWRQRSVPVSRQDSHFRVVRFLVAGFAVLVCLLIASVLVAFQAIRSTEETASRLMLEQTASSRLIDDLQRQEDALSEVFYALMASPPSAGDRAELLRQLDEASSGIHASTQAGVALGKRDDWLRIRNSATALISELRRTLIDGGRASTQIYLSHHQLVEALSAVAAQSYQRAAEARTNEAARTRAWVTNMVALLGLTLAIAIPGAIYAIRSAVRILGTMEWQTQELATLSARTMSVQEETARRFSRELHDQFGQTLTAIEANLVAMREVGASTLRIADCLALVKDAMANVRQISQLLRPSVLDDFGLDASLRWLAETFAQRTGVQVQYESTFKGRLSDDVETQLFRIAQEALTNVARHSDATRVKMSLLDGGKRLHLTIADNGRGMAEGQPTAGTGLISMRARARETGGNISIRSGRGQGFTIEVGLPVEPERHHAAENPHLVGR